MHKSIRQGLRHKNPGTHLCLPFNTLNPPRQTPYSAQGPQPMPKPADRMPPMPRVHALDPHESEQSWESAPQLLAALNGAHLGAWYWDIESGQVSWSRGTQALFGFDPHQPLPKDLEYLDLLPPEDRAKTVRAAHKNTPSPRNPNPRDPPSPISRHLRRNSIG